MRPGIRHAPSLGRISNRQRQRDAQAAIEIAQRMWSTLMLALATNGGEIEIDPKHVRTITESMDYELVDHPTKPGMKVVRLLR